MPKIKLIKEYAKLIATLGISASAKQDVVIYANVEHSSFVRYLVSELYRLKVKKVTVTYRDEVLERLFLQNSANRYIKQIDSWSLDKQKFEVDNSIARIYLHGDDPSCLAKINEETINTYREFIKNTIYTYTKKYQDVEICSCMATVPTRKWAVSVFKDVTPSRAVEMLWETILDACYINEENLNTVKNYRNHLDSLRKKAEKLNSLMIKELHFINSLGTDLRIGLPDNHIWTTYGKYEKSHGHPFMPFLPVEQIYTSPHRLKVNGTLYATRPVFYNGNIITDIFLKFWDGQISTFESSENRNILKQIINADQGSNYLGKISIVSNTSPLAKNSISYNKSILDMNASTHISLGRAYAECLKDSDIYIKEEKILKGLNDSNMHLDIMFGTDDLKIEATCYLDETKTETKEIIIFENGNLTI